MFVVLVRKEILNNILSFRFAITFLLFFLLIGGSTVMMGANYDKQRRDYYNATSAYRERVDQMRDFNEFEIFGMTSRREPNPLSMFAMGLEADMSRSVTNSEMQGLQVGGTPYSNPLFALFSTPDVAYVVGIIVSLLAILFVFDAVSGEKEQETLKLVLSNSVPRDVILMSKCVGGLICLCMSFLISLGVGLLIARVSMSLVLTSTQWLRVGGIVLVSLLYISAFLMLGLFISTCTQRSGTSLMIALLAWVVLVLGVPNLVPVIARQMVPLPSMATLEGEEEAIRDEEYGKARRKMSRNMSREQRSALYNEARQAIQRRMELVQSNYVNRFMQQVSLAMVMSRVSPSACFTYASTAFAETGVDAYTGFVRYVHMDFRRLFEQSLPAVREASRSAGAGVGAVDVKKLPVFDPQGQTIQLSMKESLIDIGLLCGYTVLFFLGAFIKFLRYDVK
jgi:ABC-type transport system involved in multi-copper enzyme maturation permease subunit